MHVHVKHEWDHEGPELGKMGLTIEFMFWSGFGCVYDSMFI